MEPFQACRVEPVWSELVSVIDGGFLPIRGRRFSISMLSYEAWGLLFRHHPPFGMVEGRRVSELPPPVSRPCSLAARQESTHQQVDNALRTNPKPSGFGSAQVYSLSYFREENSLVDALRAGRQEAQAELYRRYHGRVTGVMRRIMGSDPELSDLIQETFVQAMSSAQRFRGNADVLEAWLVRVAVYTARAAIRKRKLFRRFFSVVPHEQEFSDNRTSSMEDREALRRAYVHLDRLPTDERIVLALSLFDGLSNLEIADACEISESTVKRRLRKARVRYSRLTEGDPALAPWCSENHHD